MDNRLLSILSKYININKIKAANKNISFSEFGISPEMVALIIKEIGEEFNISLQVFVDNCKIYSLKEIENIIK